METQNGKLNLLKPGSETCVRTAVTLYTGDDSGYDLLTLSPIGSSGRKAVTFSLLKYHIKS